MSDGQETSAKNGRRYLKGICSECGCGMAKMLSGSALTLPGQTSGSALTLPGEGGALLLPGETRGNGMIESALSLAEAMDFIGLGKEIIGDSGVYEAFKNVLKNKVKDLVEIVNNPSASRYRNIYVNRLPRLGKRFQKIQNKIEFILGKAGKMTKVKQNKINRLEQRKKNIKATINQLLMQLPKLYATSLDKSDVLSERKAEELEKMITESEKEDDKLVKEKITDDEPSVYVPKSGLATWDESDDEAEGTGLTKKEKTARRKKSNAAAKKVAQTAVSTLANMVKHTSQGFADEVGYNAGVVNRAVGNGRIKLTNKKKVN